MLITVQVCLLFTEYILCTYKGCLRASRLQFVILDQQEWRSRVPRTARIAVDRSLWVHIRDRVLLRVQYLYRIEYNIVVNTEYVFTPFTLFLFMSQLWSTPRTGTRNNSLGPIMTSSSARIAFLGMCRSFFYSGVLVQVQRTKNTSTAGMFAYHVPVTFQQPLPILGLFLAFCDIVSADGVFRRGWRSITNAVVECLS